MDLADSSLGKDPSTVYGVYFTTTDGVQYALRQSENLWNPHSYCEFSWSTGVQTADIHGGILHSAHYASMEGKTIASITYITSNGIETYNLASGLYVAPHHEGEITATATSENTMTLTGVPADLENVTVTVKTSGRGAVTLADNASIDANGNVTLDEGKVFAEGTVYNVIVSSSNYAAMTTTVTYTPAQNPGTDPGTEEPGTDVPGTEEPGIEDPGTEEPGTEDPGTDPSDADPGTKAPGNSNTGTTKQPSGSVGSSNSGSNGSRGSSGSSATKSSSSSSAKTGDESHMVVWMAALLLSCTGIVVFVRMGKRKQD